MKEGSFLREFVAGNVGGLAGIVTVYPLDTLKIRQQAYPNSGTMSEVFLDMRKQDGVKSLYRGMLSPALGFGLTFAGVLRCILGIVFNLIQRSAYGYACRGISKRRGVRRENLSLSDMTMAGAFTGLVQSPVRQVMERVKSVMQVRETQAHKAPYSWSGACLVELVQQRAGRGGLLQGMTALTIREVPQFAVYYPAYHIFKQYFTQRFDSSPTLALFLAGGCAGITQWMPPILCFDAVKSHMQTCDPGTYKGYMDCVRCLYQQYGVRVFFRGFGAAVLRAFPLHGIVFLGYEFTMHYI